MMTQVPYLLLIVIIPLLGMLFALMARDNEKTKGRNVLSVSALAIVVNLLVMVRAFMQLKPGYGNIQLVESYQWLENPLINLRFGVDSFALLLIMGVYMAVLIGLWGGINHPEGQKSRMIFTLLFLSMMSGFLISIDIFSFFIFFEAMLLPLFMLVGMFGEIKKQGNVFRFMLYGMFGALLLFGAIMVLYNHSHSSISLNEISGVKMGRNGESVVWLAIFVAFLSRIPIWPFHYWVASINSGIKNPLVFIIANLIPLTGVYGFMRFWPQTVPETVEYFMIFLEVVSVISMLFIALIGMIHKDIQYKIFAYMTVYYIFYLLGVFLPTDQILINVGFSVFACLIIFATIEVLTVYMTEMQEKYNLPMSRVLLAMPKLSMILSFMVLAVVGLPLSAMFVNNFVILAGMLNYNINVALVAVLAMVLAAVGLLQDVYRRKSCDKNIAEEAKNLDITNKDVVFFGLVALILIMSFFNPLWFMEI